MKRSWLAIVLLLVSNPVWASDYPSRSVTMVVAAAAGGPIDVLTRIVAERMSPPLGQPIIVENMGGGGGIVGGQHVARATADGYTTLLGTVATHANPQLFAANPSYNPLSDFEDVALIAQIPLILIARKDLPASSIEEFVAYAKANPGKLSYGSAGVGSASHLGCAMLEHIIGAQFLHVPYRGTGPAMQDLLAGRIDFICDIAVTAVQSIKGGEVKGIAMAEKGYPSMAASTWAALFVPAHTPSDVVEKLNASAVAAMNSPGMAQRLGEVAATLALPEQRTPAYLQSFVKSEWDKWGTIIRASGAVPQ
ncbi:MAG: tripartite tricarboxylate transporter substrate-binding protein [Xanthobacteraceae bacterium]